MNAPNVHSFDNPKTFSDVQNVNILDTICNVTDITFENCASRRKENDKNVIFDKFWILKILVHFGINEFRTTRILFTRS